MTEQGTRPLLHDPAAYAGIHKIDECVFDINDGLCVFADSGDWRKFVDLLAKIVKENFHVRDSIDGEKTVQSTVVALLCAAAGLPVLSCLPGETETLIAAGKASLRDLAADRDAFIAMRRLVDVRMTHITNLSILSFLAKLLQLSISARGGSQGRHHGRREGS